MGEFLAAIVLGFVFGAIGGVIGAYLSEITSRRK